MNQGDRPAPDSVAPRGAELVAAAGPRSSSESPVAMKPIVGWREWVALPELGVSRIKCKVDTGAKSSCLHAFDIQIESLDGIQWVSFAIHPKQKSAEGEIRARAKLIDYRRVRSSSGHVELRPAIETQVAVGATVWPIQLTLTNRDEMGFRMLLGRAAIKRRFWVDPNRSFVQGCRSDEA